MESAASAPPGARQRRLLRLAVIVALAAALLLPIWYVAFPPLLDYPNHLARAFVLQHLHDPAYNFGKYYRADWGLYPYLGMDAALAVLCRIFPIETAGRVLLSLCALALPAATWLFLGEIDPGSDAKAPWVLLIAFNVFFLEGFVNFDLGLAVALAALALWLRWLKNRGNARWLTLLAAFTALYFVHLLGFAIAALVMAAYLALSKASWRDWARSGALGLPGVAAYLYSSRVGLGAQAVAFRTLDDKLDSLGMFLHGYLPALDWIALGALAAYFFAAVWRNPEFRVNWRWLGVAAFLFALFWAIPYQWGESSDLDVRVLPVVFVAILASVRVGRRGKALAAVPLVVFAAWMVSVTRHFASEQTELAGLARSFDAVPRNALVFPIVEGDQDPIERPFTHFWAYGVIRRGWYSPYLADIPGQTPMRIVRDLYTSDGFWDLTYDQPPDWAQVQEDYDYVWAYGVPRYSAPLAAIGDRVYSFGALEVYRLRKPSPENSAQ